MKQSLKIKLDPKALALAFGFLTAIIVFISTLIGMTGFGGTAFIEDIYGNFGYNVTFFGAILGAVYGFIDGFVLGWILIWFYNKFL